MTLPENQTKTAFGLIGLGNVGSDLARAALAAGLDLHAHDIQPEQLDEMRRLGATAHESPSALASSVDVLVLSLPNADVVHQVLVDDGALAALRRGGYLVDMSTNLPERTIEISRRAQERGIRVLDAPVSYGPDGLVSFVGGEQDDFDTLARWFGTVVRHAYHVGPHGHGQYVKLVQNLLNGVYMGVIAEAIGFAARAGVDLTVLPEALSRTGAYSPMFERVYPRMIERDYGQTGTLALHLKDTRYTVRTGGAIGARTPFAEALMTAFEGVLADGDPRWSQTALIEWFAPGAAGNTHRK